MQEKEFRARVNLKAANKEALKEGQFEALVSVIGNVDSVGDVVMPGAFKDNLAEWEAKGDPIPVIWSHQHSDPFAHIGHVVKAEERPDGLWVRGELDLENPMAVQVHRLLKGGRITGMSFAYDILDGAAAERDGERVYELRKLAVHEVGPTIIGANREAQLSNVKARSIAEAAKAGRVLSQKNYEMLAEAHKALGEVLSAAAPAEDAAPKTSGAAAPGTPESAVPVEASGENPSAKSTDIEALGTLEVEAQASAHSTSESIDADENARPGSRDASKDAAMPSPASARLRTRLLLAELEASLTE